MRIGIDYRFLSLGPYQVTRGMGRYTQQQLREVLRADRANEYIVCCPTGADVSLIHPEVSAAPNAAIRFIPPSATRPSPGPADDDTLERAELFQAWIERSRFDLFHATTPLQLSEPVLANFDACPLVATLYDLIPLVFPARYFGREVDADRYLRAIGLLAAAQRLIAISGSARHDALSYLGIPSDRIDVAYPVADPVFRPIDGATAEARLRSLRASPRIPRRFVLSVTHFHHSKNAEMLFSAYSLLPRRLRQNLPLVLCCALDGPTASRVRAMAEGLGVGGDVIVTGMISDDELAALYSRATVVVHPSRYEGFGLPVVEAMRCGTPVITTSSSALPEVGGDAARLVDPDDARSLATAIAEVADDEGLRREMSRRGLSNTRRFSPEQLATTTLDAYRKAAAAPVAGHGGGRPRLALWSPVPPQQSGIADYTVELVDELSGSCEVEIFVDSGFAPELALAQRYPVHHFSAFARRHRQMAFDATIYQMGNSHFHWYMYGALQRHPGIVVLHDMAWSQVLFTQLQQQGDLAGFLLELGELEGADAVREFDELDNFTPAVRDRARMEFLDRHPMLGRLVECSLAQVVHFDACREELLARYPDARPHVVQMGVADPYGNRPTHEMGAARARLGLATEAFVLGTFGIVHPVKRVESCLRAVAQLLPCTPDTVLLVVGRMAGAEYEQHLRTLAAELGIEQHVRFTGHVPKDALEAHLIASDVVVNLRTPTHHHMSAIVSRAVAAAKPIVISDLPGWDFLSDACFVRIPVDDCEVDTLTATLAALAADPGLRQRLSRSARARFGLRGSCRQMASGYLQVMEAVAGTSLGERVGAAAGPQRARRWSCVDLTVTKLCEIEDFTDSRLAPVLRKLSGNTSRDPDDGRDQQLWAAAMAVRALRVSGVLAPDPAVLAVGAGLEPVLAELADQVGPVSAAEWYGTDWQSYPGDAFGAVVCGPIEGVRDLGALSVVAAALGHTLRVGGVLSLSTRFRLHGPPGGIGWPGQALLLSAYEFRRHIVEPSGLELVGELPEHVSDRTMSGRRDLRAATSGHDTLTGRASVPGPVAVVGGYVFTMAHLLFRKTKESVMTRADPAASSVPIAETMVGPGTDGGGGEWAPRVVALQERLAALDDLVLRGADEVDRLSEDAYRIGRSLSCLDQDRLALQPRLGGVLEALGRSDDRSTTAPTEPPVTAQQVADATCCDIRLTEGLKFSVMVDGGSADPITTTFVTGYCLFQELVSLMLQLVSPGDPVLDIGAHLGTFSLAAAAAGCPVLAIEASPLNVELLRASVARNGFHQVRVVSAAASDEPGSVQFCAIGPWGTVLNRPPSALSVEVPAVTVDELVFELGFPAPRFVKMDVEGSEIRAMRGMAHLLSMEDAPALLLESNGHTLGLMGATPSELLGVVEGFGYKPYLVDRARLIQVSSTDLQPRTEVDYLALKRWPATLTGWALAPPLTTDERVAMLVEDCQSQSEDCRAYIARAIADAEPSLLARPDLRAALARLAADPVETVRGAVGWWQGRAQA